MGEGLTTAGAVLRASLRGWAGGLADPRIRLGAAVGLAVVLGVVAALARPARWVVEGSSMLPGLVPGDVVTTGWFPLRDPFRKPRRHERWTIRTADGHRALKRVAALPRETISILDGDLQIDDRPVLKDPRLLAELGSIVSTPPDAALGDRLWRRPAAEILDDNEPAPPTSHVLVPVRDVGVAAMLDLRSLPAMGSVRVRIRVGQVVVPWRLVTPGRHALVAGRLDGHVVAAAWMIPVADDAGRSCLPPHPPRNWQVARPWPARAGDPWSPLLELVCDTAADIRLVRAWAWRDIHHRPAADGVDAWTLGREQFFLLGDCPVASTDSRHWGPVPADAFRHRVRPAGR